MKPAVAVKAAKSAVSAMRRVDWFRKVLFIQYQCTKRGIEKQT
jgi:hypothetical protein